MKRSTSEMSKNFRRIAISCLRKIANSISFHRKQYFDPITNSISMASQTVFRCHHKQYFDAIVNSISWQRNQYFDAIANNILETYNPISGKIKKR